MEQQPEHAASDDTSEASSEAQQGDPSPKVRVSDRRFWVRERDGDTFPADAASGAPRLPSFVVQLQDRLAENERRLAEFQEVTRQEQTALRERLSRDAEQQLALARGEFLKSFLGILDNLDRALSAAGEQQAFEALLEGVKNIRQQMMQQFDGLGVERLETVGRPFDPTIAEAMHVQQVDDAGQDGVVLDEFEVGYRYGELILRPAKVQVGKYRTES